MIAVIDYGVGNLRSVEKAIQYAGGDARVTSDINAILKADGVVLPGVGAFAEAMDKIKNNGIAETVKKVIESNKPFLGICLGMQMLFDYSEEGSENVAGLGVFKGSIKKLPGDINIKIPHMGWNNVKYKAQAGIFNGIPDDSYFYFVHSYFLKCDQNEIVSATTDYGINIDVAISSRNVHATQFHPEKSGEAGHRFLKNFVAIL